MAIDVVEIKWLSEKQVAELQNLMRELAPNIDVYASMLRSTVESERIYLFAAIDNDDTL